jgi:ribosomal protein S18 acetylase RimI-like enzyme
VWATDIDVLAVDGVVERRDGYLVVRSPSHSVFYWGNLLLFPDPPGAGDGARWERQFEAEFADEPGVEHVTFAWDRVDGALGAAGAEFVERGYEVEETVGLVATAEGVRPHPRENREVIVRTLDPDADGDLWDHVVELQVASRDDHFEEHAHRDFCRRRLSDRRALFRAGRGAWYVATDPDEREVLGSCGVVVTAGRGRFQVVDTAAAHRRKGICSRLVVEAADRAARLYGADRFVIAADPDYHALGLYESLGFRRAERVAGVCRMPGAGCRSLSVVKFTRL